MKRIYISLPITGYDEKERRKKCESTKKELRKRYGKDVDIVSPFECAAVCCEKFVQPTYGNYMGTDIACLIDICDAVYFTVNPETTESKGVRLEYATAKLYGKKIIVASDDTHKARYAAICNEYRDALNRQWDTDGDWISDNFQTFEVADCFISNEEMRVCVDFMVDFDTFREWYRYDERVRYGREIGRDNAVRINLQHWVMGYPDDKKIPDDVLNEWEDEYWKRLTLDLPKGDGSV